MFTFDIDLIHVLSDIGTLLPDMEALLRSRTATYDQKEAVTDQQLGKTGSHSFPDRVVDYVVWKKGIELDRSSEYSDEEMEIELYEWDEVWEGVSDYILEKDYYKKVLLI